MAQAFDESAENFTEFLKDFVSQVNDGIHRDLENSLDYIENKELETYITKDGKRLSISAIEKAKHLTTEDIIELGINWARYCVHRNLHEALDKIAKKHGVETKLDDDEDEEADIELIAGSIEDMPEEVRKALIEALSKPDKKKGKK